MRMINSLLPEEIEIILGSILGDAWMTKTNQGYEYIWFSHSDKQKQYLEWLYDSLPNVRTTHITEYHYKTGGYVRYQFSSKHNPKLTNYIRKVAYNGKTKCITRKYLNLLTPLSIAVWWMDDGSLSVYNGERRGKLCTHSFSLKENKIIQRYFKVVWGIESSIKTEKGKYYFIRLNATNMKKLVNIIYPYVEKVPGMIHKVDMKYKKEKYPFIVQ